MQKTMSTQPLLKFIKYANRFWSRKQCYICGNTFKSFTRHRKGSRGINEFIKNLRMVDSDVDNFQCMYCGCHDRERHLFMFFDRLRLWESMKEAKILHFAPEEHLPDKIKEQGPREHIQADPFPPAEHIISMDARSIPFEGERFDFIIANHVLEHIPEYMTALSEFYRVLKPGGTAVMQTPYSRLLKENFEDEGINTDETRLFFYGQEDHVRIFGHSRLFKSIEEAGLILQVEKHDDYFSQDLSDYYGVNGEEDLIMAIKPGKQANS